MNTINQISKKAIGMLAMLLTIVLISSCTKDSDTQPDPTPPLTYDPNIALEFENVVDFDAFSGQLPESITMDNLGNIYLSMSPLREIWKLNPDGTFNEVMASFPLEPGLLGVSGLKFDAHDNLYVGISSTLEGMNGVWMIKPNKEKERIAGSGNILVANDLVFSPDGTLYITDAVMGAVWRYIKGGEAELWVQDEALEGTGAFGVGFPIGANGIVFTDGKNSPAGYNPPADLIGGIIVANSEKGQLVYFPILHNGSAGESIIIVANMETLFGLDGITIDEEGAIYGAVNFNNRIIRINSDGSNLSEVTSGTPLDFPTSLVFGNGNDIHKLFITNFSAIHFLSDPPMPGDATPGIISVKLGYN